MVCSSVTVLFSKSLTEVFSTFRLQKYEIFQLTWIRLTPTSRQDLIRPTQVFNIGQLKDTRKSLLKNETE